MDNLPYAYLPKRRITSREIFLKYIVRNEAGEYDPSQMFEKGCFNEWLQTRSNPPRHAARAYQCAIRNVVTGVNGTTPFPKEQEEAVLKYLREERGYGWPCFGKNVIGSRTFGWKYVRGWNETQDNPDDSAESIPISAASARQAFVKEVVPVVGKSHDYPQISSSNTAQLVSSSNILTGTSNVSETILVDNSLNSGRKREAQNSLMDSSDTSTKNYSHSISQSEVERNILELFPAAKKFLKSNRAESD